MRKLIVVGILILLILKFYCKIRDIRTKEPFEDSTSEQHCIDSCIIVLGSDRGSNNGGWKNVTAEQVAEYFKTCTRTCEKNCKDNSCNYVEVLNLKKSPPEKIKNERVNIKPDYIHITWFKPKTSKEHPVLRYICIIENETDKSITVEIPNISNNDLMEHYFRGLQKNVFYNIKIYSENNNGISNPVIINRISLSDKKTEPVKIKNEVQQTKYKTNFDETTLKNKLLESSYMKSFIIKILSPLF
tara:strand:+ start:449 stop:1180 length:732 start_codon:yes stop_codon:yes gene_type:complete